MKEKYGSVKKDAKEFCRGLITLSAKSTEGHGFLGNLTKKFQNSGP